MALTCLVFNQSSVIVSMQSNHGRFLVNGWKERCRGGPERNEERNGAERSRFQKYRSSTVGQPFDNERTK